MTDEVFEVLYGRHDEDWMRQVVCASVEVREEEGRMTSRVGDDGTRSRDGWPEFTDKRTEGEMLGRM